MTDLSRRDFATLVAAGAVASRVPDAFARAQNTPAPALTANDIVERIRKNIGVSWNLTTIDTIKAGDPSTIVTGIATTAVATLAVLQQAAKAGANLVITGEPTFYSRTDGPNPPAGRGAQPPAGDRVFAAKNELIAQHKLVVFRLTDHWRSRQPNPFGHGFANVLGWTEYQDASDPLRFTVPAVTLATLASQLKKSLNSRGGIRVVGDPQTNVRRVALLPGSTPIQAALHTLPGVDVIVAGEVREWESVEYARDTVFAGGRKGLILVGRVVSEEPAMNLCASWLRSFVTEVPVRHVAAGDPYWRPA